MWSSIAVSLVLFHVVLIASSSPVKMNEFARHIRESPDAVDSELYEVKNFKLIQKDPQFIRNRRRDASVRNQPFDSSVSIHFEVDGEQHDYHLELQWGLFSSDDVVFEFYNNSTEPVSTLPAIKKFYFAKLDDGWVNVALHSENSMYALIARHNSTISIHPTSRHLKTRSDYLKRKGIDLSPRSMVMMRHGYTFIGSCGVNKTAEPMNNRERRVEVWDDCFAGQSSGAQIDIAVAVDYPFAEALNLDRNRISDLVSEMFSASNAVYVAQMNIHLSLKTVIVQTGPGGPSWNSVKGAEPRSCGWKERNPDNTDISNALETFTEWKAKNEHKFSGALVHLLSNCFGLAPNDKGCGGTVGLAYIAGLCRYVNSGVSSLASRCSGAIVEATSWLTLAHEIGHQVAAEHTFSNGGPSRGIMDYTPDGLYDGEAQFYTDNKAQVCKHLNDNRECLSEVRSNPHKSTYHWTRVVSECDSVCGVGKRSIRYHCHSDIFNIFVNDDVCLEFFSGLEAPVDSEEPCELPACTDQFVWKLASEDAPCSGLCGFGIRLRSFVCTDTLTGSFAAQEKCTSALPPPLVEHCVTGRHCFSWKFLNWGPCTHGCGGGTQVRNSYCEYALGNKVDDSYCYHLFGNPTKDEARSCNSDPCAATREEQCLRQQLQTNCAPGTGCGRIICQQGNYCISTNYADENTQCGEKGEGSCKQRQCVVEYVGWLTSSWSNECESADCVGKTQTRTVECVDYFGNPSVTCTNQPATVRPCPDNCAEFPTFEKYLNNNSPIDGDWSEWQAWSSCSKTCGGGSSVRYRSCTNPPPYNGGDSCSGGNKEDRDCNTQACPINGEWGEWAAWGDCSVSCGEHGLRTRKRLCDSPAPDRYGKPCSGTSIENMNCIDLPRCPVHGEWSEWSEFGYCSRSCGVGTKTKTRRCDSPAPMYGGLSCSGDESEDVMCDTEILCPEDEIVDGGWAPWSGWEPSDCCATLEPETRSRSCIAPPPANGGADCIGGGIESSPCDTVVCNAKWSADPFGECSNLCGKGSATRSVICRSDGVDVRLEFCDEKDEKEKPNNVGECWGSCGAEPVATEKFVKASVDWPYPGELGSNGEIGKIVSLKDAKTDGVIVSGIELDIDWVVPSTRGRREYSGHTYNYGKDGKFDVAVTDPPDDFDGSGKLNTGAESSASSGGVNMMAVVIPIVAIVVIGAAAGVFVYSRRKSSTSGEAKNESRYAQSSRTGPPATSNSNLVADPTFTDVELSKEGDIYEVQYFYEAQNNDELTLEVKSIIVVTQTNDDGWCFGTSKSSGASGWFPGNYVQKLKSGSSKPSKPPRATRMA